MQNQISDYPLILLCGGKSSRMGSPKGLLQIDGLPWYQYHINGFKRAGGKNVILVLGFYFQTYVDDLNWNLETGQQWVSRDEMNISVILNKQPHRGQFSSIQCGVKPVVDDDLPGAYILPVDMPNPDKEVWEELSRNMSGAKSAAIPSCQGKAGHPVLLSHRFLQILLNKSPDSTEARLDRQIGLLSKGEVCYVDVDDPAILKNVNTMTEFESL